MKKYQCGICLLSMALMTGCAVKQDVKDSGYRVAAVLPENGKIRVTDFWQQVWNGIHSSIKEEGIALSEYPSSANDPIIDRLVLAYAAKPEGIILFVSDNGDEEVFQVLRSVRESGIKIVVVDTDIESELYDAFVGIDNEMAGRQLAEYVCKRKIPEEHILVLNPSASGAVEKRKNAFLDYMTAQGESEVTLLPLKEENEERLEGIEQGIQTSENLKWIVSFDPSCTVQAAETLCRMKLEGEISLVGFGESQEAEQYLENGVISALLLQDNDQIGEMAVCQMKKLLDEEKLEKKQSYVDSTLITAEEGTGGRNSE
ncbi:MAG: substrate-binding domain-containing protein [Eubacteriales bacterium]|nr:substrate-binding domain-containing protein [Eubacteriales bacterium]